jgi:hypothetical protein
MPIRLSCAPFLPDEEINQKFEDFMKETWLFNDGDVLPRITEAEKTHKDREWGTPSLFWRYGRLSKSTVGMEILVRAYQMFGHTDYGSRCLKRRTKNAGTKDTDNFSYTVVADP